MNLLKFSIRNMFSKKTLFLGTVLSVMMGVAFTVGVFIVTDSMRSAFGSLAEDIAGQIDLRVRRTNPFGNRLTAPLIDPGVAEDIREIDGVGAVDGEVFAFNVPILIDGETPSSLRGPAIGQSWPNDPALNRLTLIEGERPRPGEFEFTIDTGTVESNDLLIGDLYPIALPTGTREFRLTGTHVFGTDEENIFGAQIVAFPLDVATEHLNGGAGWNVILVNLEPGEDIDRVKASIEANVAQGTEVVTAEAAEAEQQTNFSQFINIFQYILLAFAIITLVVSAFLVNNVFSILTGQRIRELGLLRALGSTGTQVTRMVLAESAGVGVLATGIGLAGGIGVAAFLRAVFSAQGGTLPIDPVALSGRTYLVAVAVGVGITMLAALAPAIRARRVSPMAAISEEIRLGEAMPKLRPILGSALLAVSAGLLTLGLLVEDWQGLTLFALLACVTAFLGGRRIAPWVGRVSVLAVAAVLLITPAVAEWSTSKLLVSLSIGALTAFLGVNLSGPLFARGMAQALGKPFAAADGVTGELSRLNAARSPRRTSTTAGALMIGLALVATVGVVGASLRSTFVDVIDEQINADWFLCIDGCNDETATFSPQLAEDLSALPETESVASFRFQSGAFQTDNGSIHSLMATNASEIDLHLDLDLVSGSLDDLASDGVLVSDDVIGDIGLSVGDELPVEFADGSRATWRIAGVYEDEAIIGSWLTSLENFNRYFDVERDRYVSVLTASGVTEEQARTSIEAATAGFALVEVRTKAEFRDSQTNQINQALIIVNIFLGLAFVIAVLGIVATLALSVFERTRELGLLRAVGMTRSQLRRMICWEGVIVAVFGGILGVALGLVFGTLTARIIPDSVVNTLVIPVGQLILYLVLAGVAGLASGLLPAVWAGRKKILDAISYE